MKIDKQTILVRDLVAGYNDNKTTGQVRGYHGKLDIRPAYQREFVYNAKQQAAVIHTILNGFPLNTMYWVKRDDGTYEILDGQQRTISICKYVVEKSFSVPVPGLTTAANDMTYGFGALQANASNIADSILDYELDVYICEGTDSEKLAWFEVINTAGEELTKQELRNATYAGTWLSSAKAYFSKAGGKGVAAADGKKTALLSGDWKRQDYLETALFWIADNEGRMLEPSKKEEWTIEAYMRRHQGDADASALWQYFSAVVEWVHCKFTNYRKDMKGLSWGLWYNQYQRGELHGIVTKDAATIEAELMRLINDEELESTKVKDIYKYIIDGHIKHLAIRQFDSKTANAAYSKQGGKCPHCQTEGNQTVYAFDDMEADHIIPWSQGGKTELSNCQMLCKHHNRSKGAE